MAQERIEIKFIPKGNVALVKAIKELDKATRRLNGELGKLNKVNIRVAQTQDLVSKRVSANTKAVVANSTAFTRLQAVISVYRNKMLLASFAMGLFGTAVGQTVKKFADFEDLERGFNNLGRSIDSSSEFLQKLRKATNNTVDDMQLMQQANNAMMLGIVKSEEEMAELFDAAQRMGQALGRDVVSSIESLVTGMGRQSRLMLDNLGIIVKTNEAYEKYARANNLSADSLTDLQKKQAFNQETLSQSGEILEKLGIEVLSTNASIAQLQVATARLSRAFGEVLAPVLEVVATAMVKVANVLNARMIKSLAAAVATLSAAYIFNAAVLAPLIPLTLSYMMGSITMAVALKTVAAGFIAATAAAAKFTLTLLANPYFLAAAAVAGLAVAFYNFVFTQDEATDSLDDYQRKVLETNEANEEYRKSVEDNIDALEEELLLLNADNDLQRMAIRLKRDHTLETYGLTAAEIELFNSIQARKEELKFLKEEEEAEIRRQKDLQKILDDVADMHEDAGLRSLKAKLKVLQAEMALIQALMIEQMLMEESSDHLANIEAKYNEIEGAVITLEDAIKNWGQTTNKNTEEAEHALQEFLENYNEEIDAFMMGLDSLNSIFSQLANAARESAQEHIDSINEIADAELEIIRNAAKATISEEKKTRKWQRMTAKQQADYEKKIMDKLAKDEAEIEAKREADKKVAAKKANDLMKKQFRVEQAINIAQATMNVSEAITKALPNVALAAVVGVLGAAEIAMILSQKPPQMAQGGLVGGKLHSQGGTMIEAERGEFVMSRDAVNSVGLETMNRINEGNTPGAINIVFEGNVLSKDFIEDEAVPQIKEALRRGGDLGVN